MCLGAWRLSQCRPATAQGQTVHAGRIGGQEQQRFCEIIQIVVNCPLICCPCGLPHAGRGKEFPSPGRERSVGLSDLFLTRQVGKICGGKFSIAFHAKTEPKLSPVCPAAPATAPEPSRSSSRRVCPARGGPRGPAATSASSHTAAGPSPLLALTVCRRDRNKTVHFSARAFFFTKTFAEKQPWSLWASECPAPMRGPPNTPSERPQPGRHDVR